MLYGLLFRASAQTLLEVAAHPKQLGAEIGFLSVLHTWGQKLLLHPHVHCVIPAGVLRRTGRAGFTAPNFFLPVTVLKIVFPRQVPGRALAAVPRAANSLRGRTRRPVSRQAFLDFLQPLRRKEWVVYAKAPFRRPRTRAAIPGPATPIA